jgi:hypothetical protein
MPITDTLGQAAGLTKVLAEIADRITTKYLYGQNRIDYQTIAGTNYFLGKALGSVLELANASGIVTLQKRFDPVAKLSAAARAAATPAGIPEPIDECRRRDPGCGQLIIVGPAGNLKVDEPAVVIELHHTGAGVAWKTWLGSKRRSSRPSRKARAPYRASSCTTG